MASRISRSTFYALFDMDGVLVDTHQLVVDAYEAVGVSMPAGAWGKPWYEWLIDYYDGDATRATHIHGRKTGIYTKWLREGLFTPLPPADVIIELQQNYYNVGVVSAASSSAVRYITRQLGIKGIVKSHCSLADKARAITSLRLAGYLDVTYIDDNRIAGEEITTMAPSHFIWYHGQTAQELTEEMMWTP